jgi:hypothetical protein
VGKNNNIIEINGKQYDARTGAPLSASHSNPHANHHQATETVKPIVHKPQMSDVIRHPAKHVKGHPTQSSKTLMRHTVHKPDPSAKKHFKANGHTDKLVAKSAADIAQKSSVHAVDGKRAKHAARVEKSNLITRFSDTVAAQPPLLMSAPSATLTAPAIPLTSSAAEQPDTATLLQHALDNATSHTEKHPHSKKAKSPKLSRKITGLSAMALSIAVLIGVVGTQATTSLKLHMASAKAGFAVAVPGYKPDGFSVGKLNYSTGVAAIHFTSNSDKRSYALTEQVSEMNSAALRDNFITSQQAPYQTIETAGRTVYLYGQHNATWVSGGVWYQLQGAGALSDHQLVEIAKSL